MMTREEYEQRKRRLEAQLEEALELVRAGFRQQIRALEMVWMTTAAEEVVLSAIPAETARREAPAASATAAAAQPVKPSRKPRQPARKLWHDVDAIFDGLPQVFDRDDVVRAIGYEPERSSLHRVLTSFRRAGDIVTKTRSLGRIPTKYEKVEVDEETADGASDEAGEVELPPG